MVIQDCAGSEIVQHHHVYMDWYRGQSIYTQLETLLVLKPGLIAFHSLPLHLRCPCGYNCLLAIVNFPWKG